MKLCFKLGSVVVFALLIISSLPSKKRHYSKLELNCNKEIKQLNYLAFNLAKTDTLLLQLDYNFCTIFEKDFKRCDSIVLSMLFNVMDTSPKLNSYAYALYLNKEKIAYYHTDYNPGFIEDNQAYKTSMHYKMFKNKYRFVNKPKEQNFKLLGMIYLSNKYK